MSRDQVGKAESFTPWWSDPGLKEKCCVKGEKKLKERNKEGKGEANRDGSSQAVSGVSEAKSKAQRARGPKAVRCVYADWSI